MYPPEHEVDPDSGEPLTKALPTWGTGGSLRGSGWLQ